MNEHICRSWIYCEHNTSQASAGEVVRMADPKAGGKPSKGTPADKRIKENKPKK